MCACIYIYIYIYIDISGLHAGSLGLESLPFEGQSCRKFSQTFQNNDIIAHHKRANLRVSSSTGTSESFFPELFSDNHTFQTTVAISLLCSQFINLLPNVILAIILYYFFFFKTSYMYVSLKF